MTHSQVDVLETEQFEPSENAAEELRLLIAAGAAGSGGGGVAVGLGGAGARRDDWAEQYSAISM
jgi:hypothetical protein